MIRLFILISFWIGISANAKCPSSTEELRKFRDSLHAKIDEQKYKEVRSEISGCFTDQVDNHPSCLDEISMMANQKLGNWSHAEITRMASKQISYKKPEQGLPAEFLVTNPKGCKTGTDGCKVIGVDFPFQDDPQGAEKMKKLFEQKKWPWVMYRTRSSGGFDKPPNLTLVAIPGKERDIFLQISPPPDARSNHHESNVGDLPNMHKGNGVLTIITVDKSKTPYVGEMRIMEKGPQGYKWTNHSSGKTCARCHTNPLRKISPRGWRTRNRFSISDCSQRDAQGACKKVTRKESALTPDMIRRVDAMNALMPGSLRWDRAKMKIDGKEALAAIGPNLELAPPKGWFPKGYWTKERLMTCAKSAKKEAQYVGFGAYNIAPIKVRKPIKYTETPAKKKHEVNLQNVAKAAKCSQCHNGNQQGWLHRGMDKGEVFFKTVIDRQMPPMSHGIVNLTRAERFALVSCISSAAKDPKVKEAWQKEKPWLATVDCKFNAPSAGARQRGQR